MFISIVEVITQQSLIALTQMPFRIYDRILKVSIFGYIGGWHDFTSCLTKLKTTSTNNYNFMGNLLYLIAVVLIIAWLVGFFAYSAAGIIHILLVLALISILLGIIQGRRI